MVKLKLGAALVAREDSTGSQTAAQDDA